ncbi:hypothetical protein, partial [Escherichia coli]|uniref:hypothetical protein n=1 Tax=Escherichia coli TaxID=562 RepID=UPI000BDC49C4
GNADDPGELVLFLTIDSAVRARNINGYIALFMANMLKQALDMSLPRVMRGSSQVVLLGGNADDPGELVLFLTIDSAVRARNINGYIALFM